jgi:hypothetical protein
VKEWTYRVDRQFQERQPELNLEGWCCGKMAQFRTRCGSKVMGNDGCNHKRQIVGQHHDLITGFDICPILSLLLAMSVVLMVV